MFYDFKRLNSNQFEIMYVNSKYNNAKIKVLCSNIRCRNSDIPFYICNSQIKSDIQSGVIKICQVLDGTHDIKTLEYKKYDNIYDNIKNEIGGNNMNIINNQQEFDEAVTHLSKLNIFYDSQCR